MVIKRAIGRGDEVSGGQVGVMDIMTSGGASLQSQSTLQRTLDHSNFKQPDYRAAAAIDEVGLAMVTGILVDVGAPLLPPHRAHILPIICGLHRGGK